MRTGARWSARARAWAMVCVVVMFVIGVYADCDAGCAPMKEIEKIEKEKAKLERASETLRAQGETLRKEVSDAAEKVKKMNAEAAEVREANSKRVKELERAEAEARAEAKRNAEAVRALEKKIASAQEELELTKASESTRLSMCESRASAAEEAWVPVWLQRHAEPVTDAATQALEFGKAKSAEIVDFSQQKTAQVVNFGKEHIPKVVNAGKEQTAKVISIGKEQTAKVISVGKEHTTKVLNAGKGAVDVAVNKMAALKELKDDLKQARLIHEKRVGKKKNDKQLPKKFTTRQAVRAFDLADEFSTLMSSIMAKLSLKPIKDRIVSEYTRIYAALQKSYRERFIPFTEDVRSGTAKHVGVPIAGYIIAGVASIPAETASKLPFSVPKFTIDALSVRVADFIWIVILSYIAMKILKDIFIIPSNEFVSTYQIMKVPEEQGVDVVVHLPNVHSIDEVQFSFDPTWNQLTIDCDEAGHSEFITVPKCKTGIKRWAQPEPKFLDGEEILLVELRPVNLARSLSRKEAPSDVPFTPFAAVPKRADAVAPAKKAAAPVKKVSARASRTRTRA
jgi:hypothetical protein